MVDGLQAAAGTGIVSGGAAFAIEIIGDRRKATIRNVETGERSLKVADEDPQIHGGDRIAYPSHVR